MDMVTTLLAVLSAALTLLTGFAYRRKLAIELFRHVRDLVTLRMVLRDTDPEQRAELLTAHRKWKADPPAQAARTPQDGTA